MTATAALPQVAIDAFRRQATACQSLGSPFTAKLCALFAEQGVPPGIVHDRLSAWTRQMDGGGDAVPLRLTGALHFLVLAERDAPLASVYPPSEAGDDAVAEAVMTAIARHEAFIDRYLDSPPQTNETARSAILLPAFLFLQARFGLPLVASELGSSAGLNQNWHRFRYDYGNWGWGDPSSPVAIACQWRGGVPPEALPVVVDDCAGCDIAPVFIDTADARRRLKSYVWPDQSARLERLDGALAIAAAHPPRVEASGAADWLGERLRDTRSGNLHVLFHTIMWQYLPAAEQARAQALIENAGRQATANAPIAWLRFEADGRRDGAALRLTTWDGKSLAGGTIALGRGDFHGRWIDWQPTAEVIDDASLNLIL